jgi:hypothetical protein
MGAISAGTSLLGGLFGSNSAKRAAELQQQAATRANDYIQAQDANAQQITNDNAATSQNVIKQNTSDANALFSPYTQAGTTAANGLNTALQNPFQFKLSDDPGYQFRLAQGQKAVEQSAAARGGAASGGALKALTQYGQGFASNEYQNAFARHQTGIQNLFQGAGLGLNASNTMSGNLNQNSALQSGVLGAQSGLDANILMNQGTQIGNNITGAGNAGAAGAVGSGNAWSGAMSGLGQTANQLFLMNLLQGGGMGSGNGTNASNSTVAQQIARGF